MPVIAVFAVDVLLTIVFATIGRASHAEGITVSGVLQTAWPFLVGLSVGWLIAMLVGRGRYPLTLRTAWPVWVCAVAVGMLLRSLTGQGTAAAFVAVATITLGVLLLGWRLLASRWVRQSSSTATAGGRRS